MFKSLIKNYFRDKTTSIVYKVKKKLYFKTCLTLAFAKYNNYTVNMLIFVIRLPKSLF